MTILCFIGFNWHPAESADVGKLAKFKLGLRTYWSCCMDVSLYIVIHSKHTTFYDILHLCSTIIF
jgi:hypothetical protein